MEGKRISTIFKKVLKLIPASIIFTFATVFSCKTILNKPFAKVFKTSQIVLREILFFRKTSPRKIFGKKVFPMKLVYSESESFHCECC